MGQPAAKQGDQVVATDLHIVMVPGPQGQIPVTLPHPFAGLLNSVLSPNVKIMGLAAATVGSIADNTSPHVPAPPGVSFQRPPANKGSVENGSATVKINGRPAARHGDPARTCNDPVDQAAGIVLANGTVFIG